MTAQTKITNACTCAECQSMCKRPCWPTPAEAKALIDAGFGHRLQADYWSGDGPDGDDILVLCGALKHRLGDVKPSWPTVEGLTCTFFVRGRCQLHSKGLKPIEGRLSHHANGAETGTSLHERIARKMWNNPRAQKIAKDWIEKYGREHGGSGAPRTGVSGLLQSLFGGW